MAPLARAVLAACSAGGFFFLPWLGVGLLLVRYAWHGMVGFNEGPMEGPLLGGRCRMFCWWVRCGYVMVRPWCPPGGWGGGLEAAGATMCFCMELS